MNRNFICRVQLVNYLARFGLGLAKNLFNTVINQSTSKTLKAKAVYQSNAAYIKCSNCLNGLNAFNLRYRREKFSCTVWERLYCIRYRVTLSSSPLVPIQDKTFVNDIWRCFPDSIFIITHATFRTAQVLRASGNLAERSCVVWCVLHNRSFMARYLSYTQHSCLIYLDLVRCSWSCTSTLSNTVKWAFKGK